MTGRDHQAEQDHAAWLGWMEAKTYSTHPDDCDGMEEAFIAGMQAQRNLAVAQEPQPASGEADGVTPGQVFHDAYIAAMPDVIYTPHAGVSGQLKAALEIGASAVLERFAAAPAAPQPPEAETGRLLRTAAALLSFAAPAPETPADQWRNDPWDWREALTESMTAAPAAPQPAPLPPPAPGSVYTPDGKYELPQPAPELAGAPDVRPREEEPGWYDVTCGSCGGEHGTNFAIEEIECPHCEARRCPHCATWFGAEES